jgi:putative acetyltransferase
MAFKGETSMEFSAEFKGREQDIADLFRATFTDSEGADEGELIGNLARALMATTEDDHLYVFTAEEDGTLLGCIIFSRLSYDRDDRVVFLLAPVAVATDRQGQGIGQKLLTHGLNVLREAGVDIALTYGDPNYYARVGFRPITEAVASAPFKLQYPQGWLAQSLTGSDVTPLQGAATCVAALDDPAFW